MSQSSGCHSLVNDAPKLRVITHTQGKRPDLLDRCIKSVQQALPSGAEHVIIHTSSYLEWAESRVDSIISSELACFVDDDDEIHPDSLRLCLEALQGTNLGVACTNEVVVISDGHEQRIDKKKTYQGVASSPREVHHLCVIRGEAVDPNIKQEIRRLGGMGVDWLIKASACLQHGDVHVPIDGYRWYMSADSDMVRIRPKYNFMMPKILELTSQWAGRTGYLKTYNIPQL